MSLPLATAKSTTASALEKVNWFRLAVLRELASTSYVQKMEKKGSSRSIASHFILFSWVTCPKCSFTMVVNGLLLRW